MSTWLQLLLLKYIIGLEHYHLTKCIYNNTVLISLVKASMISGYHSKHLVKISVPKGLSEVDWISIHYAWASCI